LFQDSGVDESRGFQAGRMQRRRVNIFVAFAVLLVFGCGCFADTFTHQRSSEGLHGYVAGESEQGKTTVHTQEKGEIELNLAQWKIVRDRHGRNNKIIVLRLDTELSLEIETAALESAIGNAVAEGPLFILLEIDTPGGRADLAGRICNAIAEARYCEVVAFTKGGKYGGAISAGAAVAFACDKIYMAGNTIIGSATMMTITKAGPQDLKKALGQDLGEKISSAWQAYLASLAQQRGRPGLLARAMVDKDIEVIEVSDGGKQAFIEPVNRRPQQKLTHTWSKKGSLLTLTAVEAVKCGIADKVINSRDELLRDLRADGAEVVVNDCVQKAREEIERARLRVDRISKSLDLKIKQLEQRPPRLKAAKILRKARSNYKALIVLSKRYPDLNIDTHFLEEQLNSVEAIYERAKTVR